MISEERKNQLRNGLADAVRSQIEAAKRYVDSDELAYIVQLVRDVETFLLDYESGNMFAETDAAHAERDEIMAEYKARYEKIVQDEDATEEEVEFDLTLLCFEFVTRMVQFGYEEDVAREIFWESISVYYEFADDENPIVLYDDSTAIRENEIADGRLVSVNTRKQLIERFAWNENCFQPFGRDYLIISSKKS